MSANTFGSDWSTLEGQTFRFRDPLNRLRRFIPLRLDDTEPLGSLIQFKYLDWRRDDREEVYQCLLKACGLDTISAPQHQNEGAPNQAASVEEPGSLPPRYNERIAELHSEIQKLVTQIAVEVLTKLADAFALKFDENESPFVLRTRLFDHIVNGKYKLTSALNRTRSIHFECEPNEKRRIKELFIRVCPLRFNTATLYDKVRKEKRGTVGHLENAEVLMAGVDGTHARLKQDILHPGLKSTKLPESGFPSAAQATQNADVELKTFLADLYSELCNRLSASQISDISVSELAEELRSMTTTLSEQAYDRTVYCVLSLPKDETHRDHAIALINRASKLLQDIVWIEYHPRHSAAERDFSHAFAWILNLDD